MPMRQSTSATFATIAVLMLAAGLILFHFTSSRRSLSAGDPRPSPAPDASLSIYDAARSGDPVAIKAALDAGADPNAPAPSGPNSGLTPLHIAASGSLGPAIHALIVGGASSSVDARLADGRTPLMLAAEFGRPDAIAALASASAALDARDTSGRTPLLYATLAGRADNVQALLAAGASVNAADESGRTPAAHCCSSPIDARILRILLEAGADPDTADATGATAIMLAAESGDADKVLLLLNAGAAARARSADGRTALDRAQARNDEPGRRCAQILEQAAQ